MFENAPYWYVKVMGIFLFVGLLGIIPSLLIETLIWGIADGQIVRWVLIIFLISVLMPLLYKDTRKFIFTENK